MAGTAAVTASICEATCGSRVAAGAGDEEPVGVGVAPGVGVELGETVWVGAPVGVGWRLAVGRASVAVAAADGDGAPVGPRLGFGAMFTQAPTRLAMTSAVSVRAAAVCLTTEIVTAGK
jgi:hypothetical protein